MFLQAWGGMQLGRGVYPSMQLGGGVYLGMQLGRGCMPLGRGKVADTPPGHTHPTPK